jgi:hypothetical protein
MQAQTYFAGPADYDQKRPYCVVTPTGPGCAYDIHSRHSTRQAAQNAVERGTLRDSVMTITEVTKANRAAAAEDATRLLAAGY